MRLSDVYSVESNSVAEDGCKTILQTKVVNTIHTRTHSLSIVATYVSIVPSGRRSLIIIVSIVIILLMLNNTELEFRSLKNVSEGLQASTPPLHYYPMIDFLPAMLRPFCYFLL